jgi:Domain of unknown function (DUF4145)
MTHARETLNAFVVELIDEGQRVAATAVERATSSITSDRFVNRLQFYKWLTSCKLLIAQLGSFGAPWAIVLDAEPTRCNLSAVTAMIGALESISQNVLAGRLARFEDIVFAEAYSNLIEQAAYLLEKGYFLAAGVLFRAVLEEKLRRLCDVNKLEPEKDRPTINDYNQALYKANVYDKMMFKNVDAMSAIGNEAAHHKDGLQIADIERLNTNLVDFLQRY